MFNGSDEDFEIDEDFLQDVLPSGRTETVKRKSDEHVVVETKKPRDVININDDDELISEELLSLADCAEAEFVSQVNSPEVRVAGTRGPLTFSPRCVPDRSKTRRKFPGPAGLLPQLERSVLDLTDVDINESSSEKPHAPLNAPVSSQTPAEITSGPAWQEAAMSLQMQPGQAACPLGRFTVAWVRQRAVAKRLPQHKVPFLLVGVRSVDPSSRDPSVTLQDASGEMHGILHRELWAEYASQLVPGAVLALRQVGVLSTGPFARHQCLNVTANNVIIIFAPESSQGAQTTHVQSVSRAQLLQEIKDPDTPAPPTLKVPIGTSKVPRSPASVMSSPLQTSTPKPANRFFSKQCSSNQNRISANSQSVPNTQFTPRSTDYCSKSTVKHPFTPKSANNNLGLAQKTSQAPKTTFTPKSSSIPTQFTPRISTNANTSRMPPLSTQNNTLELAETPSTSNTSHNVQTDNPITASESVNSKMSQTLAKTSFFTPRNPLPTPAVQPPADLLSLLDGINPEDLFDDF